MIARDRNNAVVNVAGETLWGFQAAMVAPATVLTVLLREYGAGERLIGSISAIESGAVLLPQVIGIYLFTSRRRRRANLLLWHLLLVIPFLFVIGGLTWFAKDMSPAAFRLWAILGFACFQLGIGVILAVWLDWLAHLFGPGIRGTVFGISFCCSALAGTLGALAAGHVVQSIPSPHAFSYLYLAAGMIATLSIATFFLIRDPAAEEADNAPRVDTGKLVARFKDSLRNVNFRAFLIGRMLAAAGFSIIPFIAVHFTSADGGGLPRGTVVALGAAMTAGVALGNLGLGRLGDHAGHRAGMLVGGAVQVASLVVMLLAVGKMGCLLAYFGAGVATASGWISHTNMLYETCPHDSRVAHITVGNFVMGVVTIIAPLLSGVAAARWGMHTLFAICLVLSVCALLWLVFRVREPREVAEERGAEL